jgi:hypothetical protein
MRFNLNFTSNFHGGKHFATHEGKIKIIAKEKERSNKYDNN